MSKIRNRKIEDTNIIQELAQEGAYKYLCIDEANGIKHAEMKENVRKECDRRIKMIFKSELTSYTKIFAINALAIPEVSNGLNTINLQMKEIKKWMQKHDN